MSGQPLAVLLRLQAGEGAHAELARQVVLFLLLAELLAGAGHAGPPHAPARRPPVRDLGRPGRRTHRASLTGRRPRG